MKIEDVLLTTEEILAIIGDPVMLRGGSFWVVEGNNASMIQGVKDFASFFTLAKETLFKDRTILVRSLETYSEKLRSYCKELGAVDCHLILSPKGSSLFDYHTDPNDVYIKVLYGKREFYLEGSGVVKCSAGDTLFIPQRKVHKVFVVEDSISISFGIPFKGKQRLSDKAVQNIPYNFNDLFRDIPFFQRLGFSC